MLGKLHEHIIADLQQGARTDTVFAVTAIVFNLLMLGINSSAAGAASVNRSSAAMTILAVFIGTSLLTNGLALVALQLGKQTRRQLLTGLLNMYRDNAVDQYYAPSLLANYGKRYALFSGVILGLATTAILIPLVIIL